MQIFAINRLFFVIKDKLIRLVFKFLFYDDDVQSTNKDTVLQLTFVFIAKYSLHDHVSGNAN